MSDTENAKMSEPTNLVTAKQQPPWTMRLAHVEQRTAIERQANDLKMTIETLGAHPLLTDALNAADLAMRTLGQWHDEGEPGRVKHAPGRPDVVPGPPDGPRIPPQPFG